MVQLSIQIFSPALEPLTVSTWNPSFQIVASLYPKLYISQYWNLEVDWLWHRIKLRYVPTEEMVALRVVVDAPVAVIVPVGWICKPYAAQLLQENLRLAPSLA